MCVVCVCDVCVYCVCVICVRMCVLCVWCVYVCGVCDVCVCIGGELRSLTDSEPESYDPTVQCYWRVPDVSIYLLQVLIFALLGLAGTHAHTYVFTCHST